MRHKQVERWNFAVFVLSIVTLRMGWIFKTETVIMPGFLDYLGASGAVRGMLPLIARVGQSLPQLILAHWIAPLSRHKGIFFWVLALQSAPWLILAFLLGQREVWPAQRLTLLFLGLYALHWIACGGARLLRGVLQGKLISARQRGRLLAASNFSSCLAAIGMALWLLPRWLAPVTPRYMLLFVSVGSGFAVSALCVLALRESEEKVEPRRRSFWEFTGASAALLREDRDFRRFLAVALLALVSLLLFPHYTVFGQRALGLKPGNYVELLVAQNLVIAFGSLIMGPLADCYGNRLALRLLLFIASGVPLLALTLGHLPPPLGQRLYWSVFACLGFTPVTMRITLNYLLELAPRERYAQYLGTLNALQVVPLLFSPLIGAAIDWFSFEAVFLACAGAIFAGALLTYRLVEPREVNSGAS
ncbi:MAG TPA: MFS transporter [Armatimonadetes bacterium]|nr:MFS transporter [Armatimonadota bacterium]